MDYTQIISAAGLGGIVGGLLTTILQSWLNDKRHINTRSFQEKKEAYIGFLDAMHRSEIECTKEAALYVGHWKARIELVGSKSVVQGCNKITETNPLKDGIHPGRLQAIIELRNAMRNDLNIDNSNI